MTSENDTPEEDNPGEDNGSIEIATSGKQPKGPKFRLPTIDWISRWLIGFWLFIAASASAGILLSIFLLDKVPDMTIIVEVLDILGGPALMILTYYFMKTNGKGGDGED